MKDFGRVLTAMVTPFNKNNGIDYVRAAELARYLSDHGSDGIVVAGSTGEAATMTSDEKLRLFTAVLDAVGDRCSVIAGTGSNDTAASLRMSKEAKKVGVHGVMLVVPYYNKPSQEGMYRHFSTIAGAIGDLPIIVYNVPGRTGVNMTTETALRLADIPNITSIKEASGNLEQMGEILRSAPDGFVLYSGDDALTLPILSIGGHGIISVASHVAGIQIKSMIDAFLAGDTIRAKELHLKLLPVFKAMFIATNPTPVKAAVNMLGLDVGDVRLPLVSPVPAELAKIEAELRKAGLMVQK